MTNEERDLISQFVARVAGNASSSFSRSVPTTTPALPPIDPEADAFIGQQFQSHPEARYRITQMAVVQEAALAEAANRIQRLQAELQAAQQAAQHSQPAGQQSRGFLGSLFGGGQQQQAAPPPVWNQGSAQGAPPPGYAQPQYPPPPQYPPNMQPGMLGRGGSGFLGSALTTAAGVAGGMVAGNALMGLFSGREGGMFGGGGMGGIGGMPGETIINNNYGTDPAMGQPDPWGNAVEGPQGSGGVDPGWGNNVQTPDDGSGWADNGPAPDAGGGGWDAGGGGGFDDNSSF